MGHALENWWNNDSSTWNVPAYDENGAGVCYADPEYHTPDTHPEEFEKYRNCFRNKKDKSYWEKDRSSHGGRQYKRWPNIKDKEKGKKPNSIWPDGRVRK